MTDIPMTPDQPTPVELTEEQLDALSAAGNRALNDHYHEDLCYCRSWPTSCESSGNYFMGGWDTSAFDIGLPAVLGVWESLRNDQHAAKVAELRSDNEALRARVAELEEQERSQERNTLPDLHRQIEHHKDGKARWRKRAETAEARVAELTTAPADEATELAEAEVELEAMRREHPAPCRVPDSPDCTCPDEPSLPLCGKTVAVDGTVYAPCARHAGHSAAYCRDSAHNHYFLAAGTGEGERP